jgi:hypothetical protein
VPRKGLGALHDTSSKIKDLPPLEWKCLYHALVLLSTLRNVHRRPLTARCDYGVKARPDAQASRLPSGQSARSIPRKASAPFERLAVDYFLQFEQHVDAHCFAQTGDITVLPALCDAHGPSSAITKNGMGFLKVAGAIYAARGCPPSLSSRTSTQMPPLP